LPESEAFHPMTTDKSKQSTSPRQQRSRTRDTAATMQLIMESAAELLAEKGFTGFGVNALAAMAGVDKQLIYYHFGGIDGVLRQLGSHLDLWLGNPLEVRPGEAYGDATNRLLNEYFASLRQNTLVKRLLAWELVEPSPVLQELETARSVAMTKWVAGVRESLPPAKDIDAPAINALLLAGLHYMALREKSVGTFAGMDIKSPQGIARIKAAIEVITDSVYATSSTPAPAPRTTSSKRPRSA
jgi:AcrR family transcriptional regulator